MYNRTRECKHKSLLSGCSFVVHFVDISSCWTGLIPNLKIQNHNSSISTSIQWLDTGGLTNGLGV